MGFSNDAAQDYFDGIIDEPAYYNSPPAEKEIKEVMTYSTRAVSSEGKLATTWSNIKRIRNRVWGKNSVSKLDSKARR